MERQTNQLGYNVLVSAEPRRQDKPSLLISSMPLTVSAEHGNLTSSFLNRWPSFLFPVDQLQTSLETVCESGFRTCK